MKTFLESINAAAKYPMWILTAIRENKPIQCRTTNGGEWVNCNSCRLQLKRESRVR